MEKPRFPKARWKPVKPSSKRHFEICEETGIVGSITSPVDIIAYKYHHPEFGQVDKEVHYYLVKAEKAT